ncbi:MAG: imelysin family protein [Stappiaceae bacterium]
MHRLFKTLTALTGFWLLVLSHPVSALDEPAARRIVNGAIDGYILPASDELRRQAIQLQSDTDRFCRERNAESLIQLKKQFGTVVQAYSRISFLTFGPLMDDNRFERLAFWPDRKGIGLRQVQKILAEKNESVLSLQSLQQKSVAVQGLLALEFLLFGSPADLILQGPDADAAHACSYAQTISKNIVALGQDLSNAWSGPDGFGNVMKSPPEKNADYRGTSEAAAEILAAFGTGVETVRRRMVGDVIGSAPEKAKSKRALFWRSGNAIPVLEAKIVGLHDYYLSMNLPDALDEQNAWIHDSVLFELKNAERTIAKIPQEGYGKLNDPDLHAQFAYLGIVLDGLNDLMSGQVFDALSLTAGFNALDGD